MSEDGPEKPNLTERLKVQSAEHLAEVQDATRIWLDAHAEVLSALSKNALERIEQNITGQMARIETEVAARTDSLNAEIAEIRIEPLKMIRRTALISAGIGGVIAMIPWGVMTYLGMSVTSETGDYFEKARRIRQQEARISALESVEIQDIGSDKVLILPANVTQLYTCGTDQTPCIKLEE